jgi:menaquinone-9 beta-reductase
MTQSKIQNPKSKIIIVGAGPAGTGGAIRLAQQGFQVILIEREKFPRQKLCGEFISPECFRHFKELGVLDEMFSKGGDRITETAFYEPGGKSVSVPSKWFNGDGQSALGLSRAEMDFQLLERARNVGVEVFEETSAVGLIFANNKVCGLKVKDLTGQTREISADLLIDATGRARILGKLAEKELKIQNPKSKIQNRLVGFKTHLKNVNLEKGRCEIYFFRGGYGGLNFVENGIGNHCFLMKADIVKEFNGDAEKILREVIFKNKRAKETLQDGVPIYDWLAVAVDGFGVKNLNPAPNLLAIGDAGAFIDPFTGSGMLMALESAEILAETVAKNALDKTLFAKYQAVHHQKFKKRLQICNLMRCAAFAPNLAKSIIFALSFSTIPREILAHATRSSLTD